MSDKAVSVRGDHLPVTLPGTWTRVGWIPPKQSGTIDEPMYHQMVDRAVALHDALPFIIGDLLNWGEHRYGEKYSQAVQEKFNRTYKTLATYCSVAKAIHISRRDPDVNWSCHRTVQTLEPDEQSLWIQLCKKNGWRDVDLRMAIELAQLAKGMEPEPKVQLEFLEEEERDLSVKEEDVEEIAKEALGVANSYKVLTADLESELESALRRGTCLARKLKRYYWAWRRRAERLEIICNQQEAYILELEERIAKLVENESEPMPPYKTDGFSRIMDE